MTDVKLNSLEKQVGCLGQESLSEIQDFRVAVLRVDLHSYTV